MDAREAAQWLSQARKRPGAYGNIANIEASERFLESRERDHNEHVCTLPFGRFGGYRWYNEGKIIYLMPIIDSSEAS